MKKLTLTLLVVPLIQGCNQQSRNGRFQIVAGTYDEVVNSTGVDVAQPGGEQNHGIFRIDTQTGRAWIYLDVIDITTNSSGVASTFTHGWREIKDLPPSN